jgi:hypothetical protein
MTVKPVHFLIAALLILIGAQSHLIDPLPTLVMPRLERVQSPQDVIFEESLRAGINPHLPLYIGWQESRYTPGLVSPTNDWGVMQLHESTWRALHVTHPLDVRQNVIAGVGVFAHWLRVCGSERRAMRAYAKGECAE